MALNVARRGGKKKETKVNKRTASKLQTSKSKYKKEMRCMDSWTDKPTDTVNC